jgi:hypothetical protein
MRDINLATAALLLIINEADFMLGVEDNGQGRNTCCIMPLPSHHGCQETDLHFFAQNSIAFNAPPVFLLQL